MANINVWDRWELVRTDTKEDLKSVIERGDTYQELYSNAIKILRSMERDFTETLRNIWRKEQWDDETMDIIYQTRFDWELDTDNPVTIFEKKCVELLGRSKDVMEKLMLENATIQIMKLISKGRKKWEGWTLGLLSVWLADKQKVDWTLKNSIVDELRETREYAIQDFRNDVSDGVLSNVNNVDWNSAILLWSDLWGDIFWNKETMQKWEFEYYVNKMNLPQLMFWTFNINEWSGAFKYCYWKVKEKLGNQNLFDYIDSQRKEWDVTAEVLKYSALKSLFGRRQLIDLEWWVNSCSEGKDALLNYIKSKLKEDESFKIAFLTSMEDMEDSNVFWDVVKELEDSDESVRMARERAESIDNADCFSGWKIDGLAIYDDEWHWGGSAFFQSELQAYSNRWFSISPKEENSNYIKYVLKKGTDSITMVKLKMSRNLNEDFDIKNVLADVIEWKDFNFFALRGHCFNTEEMAYALGWLNAVWEWDIVIDWGCCNARKCWRYNQLWVKWQIFAYTSEWRWASTQDFINRVISTKNSWKSFSDLLEYYDNFDGNEYSVDGYFAFNTQRANSVAVQYMRFARIEHGGSDESMGLASNTEGVLHEEHSNVSNVSDLPADMPSFSADVWSIGWDADV